MEEFGIGYRFMPTDVELVRLLRLKVEGKSLCSKIIERDIYGENGTPWMIFKEDDPWEAVVNVDSTKSGKNMITLYVITKLVKKSKVMTTRVAGCGTWEGQTGKSYIKMNDKKIGYKRMFNFRAKKPSSAGNTDNWIMHEFQLDGDFLNGFFDDYAICRIKRVCSKKSSKAEIETHEAPQAEKSPCLPLQVADNDYDQETRTKAVGVQECQEHSSFPDCAANSIQESAKRRYATAFEEETCPESQSFKNQRTEDMSRYCSVANVMQQTGSIGSLTTTDTDVFSGFLQNDEVLHMPDWTNCVEPINTRNGFNAFMGTQTNEQNEKFVLAEWSNQDIDDILGYLDQQEQTHMPDWTNCVEPIKTTNGFDAFMGTQTNEQNEKFVLAEWSNQDVDDILGYLDQQEQPHMPDWTNCMEPNKTMNEFDAFMGAQMNDQNENFALVEWSNQDIDDILGYLDQQEQPGI